MNTNTLLVVLAVIVIAIGGYFYFNSDDGATELADDINTMTPADTTSGMRAEENMVVVMEQRPGKEVTGTVFLTASGYLVIHDDNNGEAGAVLGSSALLPAGESSNVKVTLSRAMKDGETLHAMLHFEKGGNATFSATEDTPIPSRLGGPISGWFEVSVDAPVDVPIAI